MARRCPSWQFALLRRQAPVFRHPWPGSDAHGGFWCLTLHEDVRMATRDPETFSSSRNGVLLDTLQTAEEREAFQTIIDVDPPEHTRLRRLVNRAFTPRAIAEFEDQYRAAVAGCSGRPWRRPPSISSPKSPPISPPTPSPSSSAFPKRTGIGSSTGRTRSRGAQIRSSTKGPTLR